jgi:hypothetical protein
MSRIAWAQAYPTRPIRLVVPLPPGGAFDFVGRPWADKMKSLLGTIVLPLLGHRNHDRQLCRLGARLLAHRYRVPPVPLQKKFAQRVIEIRDLEAAQGASRRRLDDLFQSMLHRAFNGEL